MLGMDGNMGVDGSQLDDPDTKIRVQLHRSTNTAYPDNCETFATRTQKTFLNYINQA